MRIAFALALIPLGLAGCGGGGGSGSTGAGTTAPAGPPFEATLKAPTHTPLAGAAWPITVTARTDAGRPLRAVVEYQYLFGGRVVARRSHYRFRGTFHDVIRWPARSATFPLTFRAVVTSRLGTRNLDYPVQVRAR